MIPIDFEVNQSKAKVTVTFNMLTCGTNLVQMISRHKIDLGLSNFTQTCISGVDDFEVNRSKVKVTVTINILTYRPNLAWMISRHRIGLGSSYLAQTFVLECR